MKSIPTEMSDVTIVKADVFGDQRGYFMETWQVDKFAVAKSFEDAEVFE